MKFIPCVVVIEIPVRAFPESGLGRAVFQLGQVELPGLAVAYAAAETVPEEVVYELGAEFVDVECCRAKS